MNASLSEKTIGFGFVIPDGFLNDLSLIEVWLQIRGIPYTITSGIPNKGILLRLNKADIENVPDIGRDGEKMYLPIEEGRYEFSKIKEEDLLPKFI